MRVSEIVARKRATEAEMVDPTEGIEVMNEEDNEPVEPSEFSSEEVTSLTLAEDRVIHDESNFLTQVEIAMLKRRGYTVLRQGEDPVADIPDNKTGFKGYLKGVLKALDKFDPPEAAQMKKYVQTLMAKL